eukprot:Nk52_evm2s148 gene=Nk52_evmTU2s148
MSYKIEKTLASLPKTARSQPVHLGVHPKGTHILYTCGNTVLIRNIEDTAVAETYNEHSCQATVARFAPSGFYIASADVSGKVRIWDCVGDDRLLKYEYRPLSGAVKDMQWSEDSKRIVVGGEGKESFGTVFLWDTGSSVGTITGHSSAINSCDFKQTRPFRIVTAGEDKIAAFFHGPPFKFQFSLKEHTRFVNCCRFSKDGSKFATCGSDYKVFLYDGKDGTFIGKLGGAEEDHKGSVVSCAWSPDGSQILTASSDKTCKLWSVADNKCISTFAMGDTVDDQQVGCLWDGPHMISVSLSGYINYLDPNNPSSPLKIVKGHNKSITALSVCPGGKKFFTGSYEGRLGSWNTENGQCEVYSGAGGPTNQVTEMCMASESEFVTCGMDDTVRFINASSTSFDDELCISLDSMPVSICSAFAVGNKKLAGVVVVACLNELVVLKGRQKVFSMPIDYEPEVLRLSVSGLEVLVGCKRDNLLRVYELSGDGASLKATSTNIKPRGQVTAIAYSKDGQYVAFADTSRNIFAYNCATEGWYGKAEGEIQQINRGWVHHNAKINSLCWSPDGLHLVSGGLDTNIIVWGVEKVMKRVTVKNAHGGSVTRVGWLDDNRVISCGDDACVKVWGITHH